MIPSAVEPPSIKWVDTAFFQALPKRIGAIVALVGILVVVSWVAHWHAVLQLLPNTSPMRFNTALGFIFCGLGLFLAARPNARIVPWLGGSVVLIALLTELQYITGKNFGIDQFFLKPYFEAATSYPGRMSPLAAMCFMLAGLELMRDSLKLPRAIRRIAAGLPACIVLAIAIVALAGYAFNIESAFGWGAYSRMAVNTAATFALLSTGLLLRVGQVARHEDFSSIRWLPVTGATTLMLMIAFISVVNMAELKDATAWRKHTYDVIESAQTFNDDFIGMQRNLRGYVTLGTPELLVAYQHDTNLWSAKLSQLMELTRDNSSQKPRLQLIATELQNAIRYDDQVIATYLQAGPEGVLQLDVTGKGRAITGLLLASLKAFSDQEKTLLNERDAKEESGYQCVENLLIFGSALSAVLLIMANSMASRELMFRHSAEAKLKETLAFQKAILNSADYGIVTTGLNGIIKTLNPAAEKILGYSADEVVAKKTPMLWRDPLEIAERAEKLSRQLGEPVKPNFDSLVAKIRSDNVDEGEWTFIRKDGSRFTSLLVVTPLADETGQSTGYLGVFRDITNQKKFEAEREKLILELREALAQVKTLSGLIPICGWCKNVRSDQGFWQTVEHYVHSHTNASFSHGICPACTEKFKADIAKSKNGQTPAKNTLG